MVQIVKAIFNMAGTSNPKEDMDPEKRVERIFRLLDMVSPQGANLWEGFQSIKWHYRFGYLTRLTEQMPSSAAKVLSG